MRYLILALLIHGIIFIPLWIEKQDDSIKFNKGQQSLSLKYNSSPKKREEPKEVKEEPKIEIKKPLPQKPKPILAKPISPSKKIKKETPLSKVSSPLKSKTTTIRKRKLETKLKEQREKSSIKKTKGVTSKAIALQEISPTYPWRARRRGWEGDSRLEFIINKQGKVAKVLLLKSSGYEALDKEAVKALQKATFKPAMKDGKNVASKKRLTISFQLNENRPKAKFDSYKP